jgi:hypothetical protein
MKRNDIRLRLRGFHNAPNTGLKQSSQKKPRRNGEAACLLD